MHLIYLEAAAMYLVWTVALLLLRGKARRLAGVVGAVLSLGVILTATVFNRGAGNIEEINLVPFHTLAEARSQRELYRSSFLNMALFLPLGLSLPHALPEKLRHKALVTAAAAAGLSVAIEAVQYFFRLGYCETDDVIMNTLGALVGSTSFLLISAISKAVKKKSSPSGTGKNRRD